MRSKDDDVAHACAHKGSESELSEGSMAVRMQSGDQMHRDREE